MDYYSVDYVEGRSDDNGDDLDGYRDDDGDCCSDDDEDDAAAWK